MGDLISELQETLKKERNDMMKYEDLSSQLAKEGFQLIRNLLDGRISGGKEAALELAEALHNFPTPDNEITYELTEKNLKRFVSKYPDCADRIYSAIGRNLEGLEYPGEKVEKMSVENSGDTKASKVVLKTGDMSIRDLPITVRNRNVLLNSGVETVDEFLKLSNDEIGKLLNIGKKGSLSLIELRDSIEING